MVQLDALRYTGAIPWSKENLSTQHKLRLLTQFRIPATRLLNGI